MNANPYPHLFQPIRIGSMRLRNRIVMSPMHTKFADESGGVTDRLLQYHAERAKGGVGLIVVENTCIDWELGRATGNPVTIHDDLFRGGLSDLVELVHRYGAKIIPELHHAGRQNVRANTVGHQQPIAPSAVQSTIGGDEPRAMTEEEIERTIQQFVDGARRAKECGFDGVELHGAHGYLLTQFLSPHTNRRTDRWGGTLENRARFAREILRRTRAVVGQEFPILYRISAEERIPNGLGLEEAIEFVRILESEGLDAIDVTAGIYESMPLIFTMQGTAPGALVPLAAAMKRAVKIPVIAVSSLGWTPQLANDVIRNEQADLVSIGRTFLADPHWAAKARDNRVEEIRPCIRCNECVGFLFYGWRLHCVVNPETGFEYRKALNPAAQRRRVIVVGAGLAGLEYAITAARRGHEVTLLEKTARIGGQLNLEKMPAYKSQELSRLLEYYEAMLRKWEVNVRLELAGETGIIARHQPDIVVLATGVRPKEGRLPGKSAPRLAANVLGGEIDNLGQRVCIVGGDLTGVDCALYLTDVGRQVSIIEPGSSIGYDANPVMQWQLKDLCREHAITVLTEHQLVEVTDDLVYARCGDHKVTVPFDSLVASFGYEADDTDDFERALQARGYTIQKVGSCAQPGRIYEAVHGGFWAAVEA